MIVYFVLVPITLSAEQKFNSSYFASMKTPGFLLSFVAIIAHFFISNFIMIERDYKWIIVILSIWAVLNLTVETDGLLFNLMKGTNNVIKISMAAFFILAVTCLFTVLTELSQMIKGTTERKELRKIYKVHGKRL